MSEIKIQLKLGATEVSYEGPEEFAETSLMGIIQQISEVEPQNMVKQPLLEPPSTTTTPPQANTTTNSKLSTTDFAVKMGAKSGTDLVMAAAAYLHHTRSLEEFRRSDLLTEMKGAKAFYRASYGGNLSKSLETLTKSGRLQNPKADTFTLPYSEIELTSRLLK